MLSRIKKFAINAKSFIYAIAVHAVVVVLLLVSFNWGPTSVQSSMVTRQVEPVQAKMVTEAEINKQLDAIKAKEEKKKKEEFAAKKRLEDLLNKQQQEKERLADLKKKQLQEKKKANELATKRKLEEQRIAKLRKEQDRKKRELQQREAENRRQQELAEKKKREREAKLREQLEAEVERRRIAQAVNDARSRYIPIIQQKVDRNWTRPAGMKGLNAGVRVRLTPNGEVISATVVRSSGNPIFDRSVENAILKASPLPIPSERGVNEQFRDIQFNFDPDKKWISQR